MSLSLVFATPSSGALPGCRRLAARWTVWIVALLVALAGLAAGGAAQAANYNFGKNNPKLDFCKLEGTEYSCTKSPWVNWNDQVVIASNYTLKIAGNVTVEYNHSLQTSSNSVLIVNGNLNLTGINPPNLKVSGGSIEADGIFSVGALQHTLTADIAAGAITLGTDRVTITGNLVSKGLVSISANSRVTGDVSGTVVTTDSSVTITGAVSATSRFTMGSKGVVTKKVTAPVFEMQAENGRVTGDIEATTSVWLGSGGTVTGNIKTGTLTMQPAGTTITGSVIATSKMTIGSGNTVTGDVDTGELFLESSRALITGNAKVNWATLDWEGRVSGTIFCKNGTGKNSCDCVTNRSGWAVNSANGPKCEGVAPSGPHHLRIIHDGVGDTCLPEKITVTACANAACTAPHHTGAVSGKLQPFNLPFSIAANAGSQELSVTRIAEGSVKLSLDAPAGTTTACYRTSNNTNSCDMSFAGGVKLLVEVPNHLAAASGILATVKGVKANDSKTACVAAFESGKTYDVGYSCNYSKPAAGSEKLTLGGSALACGATTMTIKTEFKSEATATLPLAYPDAGEVRLNASVTVADGVTATGSGSFITGPAKFTLAPAAGPLRAGGDVEVVVTALNSAGAKTPNFATAALNGAGASSHDVALAIACYAQDGNPGSLFSEKLEFKSGVAKPKIRWSEVGKIDLSATLSNFMGIQGLGATGSTNTGTTGTCAGKVGPFIPQYFKVEIERPGDEKARAYDYSREPFVLAVTAMNKSGQPTRNYHHAFGYSEALVLSAVEESGAAISTEVGQLSVTSMPAAQFEQGRATTGTAFAFKAPRTAPRTIRLRAANGKAPSTLGDVSSAYAPTPDPDAAKEARTSIRSGRLRLVNRFGSARGELNMPVLAEIWSGNSWVQHTDDIYTSIPVKAFGINSHKQTAAQASMVAFQVSVSDNNGKIKEIKLVNGIASLPLKAGAGGPGWGDVVANLGAADNLDASCLTLKPASTATNKPWLRSTNACKTGNDTDPSARATFGVFEPEAKRIIHVREAFH